MAKMNILVNLEVNSDSKSTNQPQLTNFNWTRQYSNLMAEEALSLGMSVAASSSRSVLNTIHNKSSTILDLFNLTLVSGSTYELKEVSGTTAQFITNGVKVGNYLNLTSGPNKGTYVITNVVDEGTLQFSSLSSLTNEVVSPEDFFTFTKEYTVIYVESESAVKVKINEETLTLKPTISCDKKNNGFILITTEVISFFV